MTTDISWQTLRSDIYIRDKGICWICNTFVDLKDYDLGHLVDKCNGGHDAYDNLAVMHKSCNLSKPRHTTLEEAMKWKLTPQYLTDKRQPKPNYINSKPYKKRIAEEDYKIARQLIIEYFEGHPELLTDGTNHARAEAIRQMASTFNISVYMVCEYIRVAGLVKPRKQVRDGSQYKYVITNLDELLNKYYTLPKHKPQQVHKLIYIARYLNISTWQVRIMFYLADIKYRFNPRDLHSIISKLTELNIDLNMIRTNMTHIIVNNIPKPTAINTIMEGMYRITHPVT